MNPRALPPVTQGSALQAPERMRGSGDVDTFQKPERMRGTCDVITYPHRTNATYSTRLPGRQYHE